MCVTPSQPVSSSSESAQNRFGGAKSISSDQYFSRDHVEVSEGLLCAQSLVECGLCVPLKLTSTTSSSSLLKLRKEKVVTAGSMEPRASPVMTISAENQKV